MCPPPPTTPNLPTWTPPPNRPSQPPRPPRPSLNPPPLPMPPPLGAFGPLVLGGGVAYRSEETSPPCFPYVGCFGDLFDLVVPTLRDASRVTMIVYAD